jgi:homoserine kinase type II
MSRQPLPAQAPHIGPVMDERARHERFAPHELAMVLSHYDIGAIRQIRPCRRGSRRAPKLRIRTDHGQYLLKRRAPGHDDPQRVAFTHSVQLELGAKGFPVPRLIGTREQNNSMLQLHGRIYELFEFVSGERCDPGPRASAQAGAALGRLHGLLGRFEPAFEPPAGTYHAAGEVDATFARIVPSIVSAEGQEFAAAVASTAEYLRLAYHDAGQRVDEAGFAGWRPTFLHGDWHPGNLIFRDGSVAAVLDFDSARREPRMADVANGVLQFSLRMTDPLDPRSWPEGLEPQHIQGFMKGYDAGAGASLDDGELAALPWLIAEALIVESIVPIAATGGFGRISGSQFLQMVERKIRWLRPRAGKLVRFLNSSGS